MTTALKHSPTPWYCHLEGSVRICNGDHDIGCSAIAEAEVLGRPRAEAMANAAFIVLAVNNFEPLLEAAKALRHPPFSPNICAWCGTKHNLPHKDECPTIQADAAIEAVEGRSA